MVFSSISMLPGTMGREGDLEWRRSLEFYVAERSHQSLKREKV